MASLIYNSVFNDLANNAIDFTVGTYKAMLTTSAYTPTKSHAKRSDVTNEVTGTGYTAGGNTATVTVAAIDNTNNREDVTLGGTTWTTSTITARYAVYYKSNGGAASADQLVAVVDFGADVASSAGTFTLTASTLRFQN